MIHNPADMMARAIRELRIERDDLKADILQLHGQLGGMTKALNEARRSAEEWAWQCDAMTLEVLALRQERCP
jgi:phage shock protein A